MKPNSQNSNQTCSGVHSLIGRANCDLTEQWGGGFHGHAMPLADTWYRQLNTLLKIHICKNNREKSFTGMPCLSFTLPLIATLCLSHPGSSSVVGFFGRFPSKPSFTPNLEQTLHDSFSPLLDPSTIPNHPCHRNFLLCSS